MKIAVFLVCCIISMAGCSEQHPEEDLRSKTDPVQTVSPLRQVQLREGLEREKVEKLIEKATGIESKYNIYTMHNSTEERYNDGMTLLIVKYKPGARAPWIETPNGIEHLPPVDATVLSWRFVNENK